MNLKGILRPARVAFLIGLAVFLLGGSVWRMGWFQEPELWFYDQFVQRDSQSNATDPRIMLVLLDEKDINQIDYPIRDKKLSELLEKIESGGANVIGIDLYRDLPEPRDRSEIAQLNETLTKHDNIIGIALANFLEEGKFTIPPPPAVKDDSSRFGLNNFLDGKIIRRGLAIWPNDKNYKGDPYYSFPLQLALYYLGTQNIDVSQAGGALAFGKKNTILPVLGPNDGGYVDNSTGVCYAFMQDFRGPWKFNTVSVGDVLAMTDASIFKDKIVLLGIAAGSSNDLFTTPISEAQREAEEAEAKRAEAKLKRAVVDKLIVDQKENRVPGVFIHAQIVNQLLRLAINGEQPVTSMSQAFSWTCLAIWCVVGVLIGFFTKSHHVFALTVALGLVLIVTVGWAFFVHGKWILVFTPAIVFTATTMMVKGYAAAHEEEQRKLLMKLFGQRVNPEVAEEIYNNRDTLLEGGRLAPRSLVVTALFTDLKNYSTISEGMTPVELINWVNECQAALTKHVKANKGMPLCFMGDGMMATFGAPIPRKTEEERATDAINAVRSAIGMGDEIRRMNAEWKAAGRPLAGLRIGIFTGEAVGGDIGNQEYFEYSVIGDTINTASRLESVDKEGTMTKAGAEVRILIGARTFKYISNQFPARHVGSLALKGKTETTEIYKVLDSEDEPEHTTKAST